MAPLYVGWDWSRLRKSPPPIVPAHPSQPMDGGLKNPLLDDGPDGVDVPAFVVTTEPAGMPPRSYADAGSLRVTLHDQRPVLLLADTAETGAGPALAFQRDFWLLWNVGPVIAGRWDRALQCEGWRIALVRLGGCGSRYMVLRWKRLGWPTRNREPYCGIRATVRRGNSAWRQPVCARRAATASRRRRTVRAVAGRRFAAVGRRWSDRHRAGRSTPCAARSLVSVPTCWRPVPVNTLWLDGPWNDEIQRLHQALHFSTTGRYVHRQVATFNARQLLAAVRWRPENADLNGDWRADWKEVPLMLTESMPLLAGRLFIEAPRLASLATGGALAGAGATVARCGFG